MNTVVHPFQSPIETIDGRTIGFTLAPTSVTYANTLRRAIQTEVLTLCFRADMTETGTTSDVKVLKNTTPMSNEMLADRVGLLCLAMPKGVVNEWDKNSHLFKLNVKNETNTLRLVTASDFQVLRIKPESEGGDGVEREQIPNTLFFHPDPVTLETCILAVLKPQVPGQAPEEVSIEAYASLGKGREHTRFNPTSQCAYSYSRDTDESRIKELWIRWLVEQKKVMNPNDLEKDEARKTMLEREFRSLEIQRCYKIGPDGEPNSFDFTIETLGTMSPYAIISRALRALITLCDKYASLDSGDLPDTVEIRPADARMKGFDIWFDGEDHTLGNLLQTYIDDNLMDSGDCTFVGYKVPHPLREEMLLRIGVNDLSEATARLIVAKAAKGCANMFADWAVAFDSKAAGDIDYVEERGKKEARGPWEAHAEAKYVQRKGTSGSNAASK
jgi:DNA-directed RNA polymerase subunit L